MRRACEIVLTMLFAVCLVAGFALAQEGEPYAPLPGLEISWAKLLVAALGLFGLLERVRDWIRRYRQHIDLVYQCIESISQSGAPEVANAGEIVKARLRTVVKQAPKPIKDMALLGAFRAEEANGTPQPGGATRTVAEVGRHLILRTLLRLVPVIGRFV